MNRIERQSRLEQADRELSRHVAELRNLAQLLHKQETADPAWIARELSRAAGLVESTRDYLREVKP